MKENASQPVRSVRSKVEVWFHLSVVGAVMLACWIGRHEPPSSARAAVAWGSFAPTSLLPSGFSRTPNPPADSEAQPEDEETRLCDTETTADAEGQTRDSDKDDGAERGSELSYDDHYTNVDGEEVHSPAYTHDGQPPIGATARCRDGTYSYSRHHRGTCSHHGGVAEWYD